MQENDGHGFSYREPEDDAEPEEQPRRRRRSKDGETAQPRRRDRIKMLISGFEFILSRDGIAYAGIPWPTHIEWMLVDSRAFRALLSARYCAQEGAGLSGTTQADAVQLCVGLAQNSGVIRSVWRRVAWQDGRIYIDLGGFNPNEERRAIEVQPGAWNVIEAKNVPVIFLRQPDAMSLPEPMIDEAKLEDLGRFANLASEDDLLLVWAWIMCAMRPFVGRGSYPLLFVSGEQGSAKSSFLRALQHVLDPTTLTGRSLPKEERELFITAKLRHLLVFDNQSNISGDHSDAMSRVSTGGSFIARSLHTNDEEIAFSVSKPMALNGIPSNLLGRPDLADRTLQIELKPLAKRKLESQVDAELEQLRPGLLGLVCDGLAAALLNIDGIEMENLPRMADAASWAEAAAPGLGIDPGRILLAWRDNRDELDRLALSTDNVALAIVALMADRTYWEDEPSRLYDELCALAGERAVKSPLWPRNAAGLTTKLRRVAPALRSIHKIDIVSSKGGTNSRRMWTIRRQP